MGKAIFVGKREELFLKALGIKVLEKPEEEIGKASLIFCEVSLYEELKKKYPDKLIVPLTDKEGRLLLEEKVKEILKRTVGERVYG